LFFSQKSSGKRGSLIFKPSPKRYFLSQEKALPPEETIKRALKILTEREIPLLESVFRIDFVDRLGIPVYVGKPSREVKRALSLSESFGKGLTEDQAMASALMEFVERFSLFSLLQDKSHFERKSLKEIKDLTYTEELLLKPLHPHFLEKEVLEELSEIPLLLTRAYDLLNFKEVPFPLFWFYRIYGTSGWASGNTLEEATLQAICEVIERHCISIVMEERLVVPTIAQETLKDPLINELLEKINKAGIEIYLKDFSLGLGIPTIGVISFDRKVESETLRIYGAAGTHPNPKYALIRALTELLQHRAQVLYAEKVLHRKAGPTFCFLRFKEEKEAEFFKRGKIISFEELPSISRKDFKEEIEILLGLLKERGFQIFLKIATHPEISLPAVAVIIPSARLNRPSTKLHPYLHIAWNFMDLEDYERALTYFDKALGLIPDYQKIPQILLQAFECSKKLKDRRALYFAEKLIEIYPEILNSKRFLESLKEIGF